MTQPIELIKFYSEKILFMESDLVPYTDAQEKLAYVSQQEQSFYDRTLAQVLSVIERSFEEPLELL